MTDIFAGDDDRLEITVRTASGDPVSLTGVSLVWALARSSRKTPELIKRSADSGIEVIDAEGGRCDVILDAADTADLGGLTYYHELQLEDADGKLTTTALGELTIRPAVIDDANA